ncbi:divergent PAP2 family protein [Paenibacillus sedimenti]|uniref:Divergent PAP2 family protein n=1 Tax=Paenibacillus sedimenti TaxID=2770274 RepID=A0A926KKR2_9BACL|nr:divergent PAP2 family protein [Paenibacillus sedimenti]MBD0378918.1 divergent PAP2 family protein [Paenibacillus sedimenti]
MYAMYAIAPFLAWLCAGILKFVINQLRYGNARARIGNGGFPSNHTTIMTTTVMLIGFREGFDSALFGLGAAITFIVIIDATGLRRHVGRHAERINALQEMNNGPKLRESMGHNRIEVLGGLVLGSLLGYVLSLL